MPNHRPLLKLRAIFLQEKWKPEISRLRTIRVAWREVHGTIGRVVMWLHFNRTIGRSGFGTSKVKHGLNLGTNHTHHRLYELAPYLDCCPAVRTIGFGRGWTGAILVRAFVTLIGGKWSWIVPLVRGIQANFKRLDCFSSLVFASNKFCDFVNLLKKK